MSQFDRWDAVTGAGAALAGAGVWTQWGPAWALMLWGGILLGLAGLHAWRSGGAQ